MERLVKMLARQTGRVLPGKFRASIALVLRVSDSTPNGQPALERFGRGKWLGGSTGEALELLLIRRALREGDPWSGHVAFPGGRADPEETDQETAVRETGEEIGLDLMSGFNSLGRLDDIPLSISGRPLRDSTLSPFIYLSHISEVPRLKLSEEEVDAAFWVPLNPLMEQGQQIIDPYYVARNFSRDEASVHPSIGVTDLARNISFSNPSAIQRWSRHPPRLWGLSLTATSSLLEGLGYQRLDSNPSKAYVRPNRRGHMEQGFFTQKEELIFVYNMFNLTEGLPPKKRSRRNPHIYLLEDIGYQELRGGLSTGDENSALAQDQGNLGSQWHRGMTNPGARMQ
eukprot:CAMPEP_0184754032 /NCGR_PEP_ID=MMETSP0315-20130426/44411_1 /TAXON_ID=101924 /ORGANISM="Rhodosorus marinus, Strain UTEX LB 2760" /LENGTH=341 /DNA_ID=CAMNT_0027233431 /DNA_START=271 /DNA_END=1297 /DNA_ORIENTATION=-